MSVNKVDPSTGDLTLISGGTLYADTPVGTIQAYGGSTFPSGWLLCDGTELNRADYPELFAVIGTSFGTPSANTKFNIPDLRGEFLRGAGTNSHSGQGNGGTVGQHQNATTHLNFRISSGHTALYMDAKDGINNTTNEDSASENGTDRVKIASTSDGTAAQSWCFTSRPTNTSVNYIIKAVQTPVPADFMSKVDEVVEEALDGIGTVYTRQISVQAIEGGDWHVLDSLSVSGLPNGNYLVCLKGTPNVVSQNFTSILQINGRGIGHSIAGGSYPYLSDSIIYTKSNDNAISVGAYVPSNSSVDAGTIYFDFVRLS